jgi:hypothetical protein
MSQNNYAQTRKNTTGSSKWHLVEGSEENTEPLKGKRH